MTKKTLEKYKALINRKVWSEQEIISFRSMLRRENSDVSQQILSEFRKRTPYKITRMHSIKGLDWLKRVCFKANGEIRNTPNRPFETWECEHIRKILNTFSPWTLDDVSDVSISTYPVFLPVYTLHSKSGDEFTYQPSPNGLSYNSSSGKSEAA